jgi:hypothetical protein
MLKIFVFQLQVINKSYSQVLTPVQQLSAAFKAGNSRRAHFTKWQHKESDML